MANPDTSTNTEPDSASADGAAAKSFGHGPEVIAAVLGAVVMLAMLLVICVSVNGAGVASVTVTTMGIEDGANASEEVALAQREAVTEPELFVYSGNVMAQALDGTLSEQTPLFTVEVPLNRTVTLDKLTARGTYTLVMNVTPQLQDGTTFLTPDPQVIELQGNNVDAQFLMVEAPEATGSVQQAQQAVEEAAEKASEQQS